ncbi:hypothetical protein EDB84DRAFT_1567467 [Lactarius hengduanensis]|nr:hypothetical protein EDB84DRAFT_1567467 [Lactarius hengduanensis]
MQPRYTHTRPSIGPSFFAVILNHRPIVTRHVPEIHQQNLVLLLTLLLFLTVNVHPCATGRPTTAPLTYDPSDGLLTFSGASLLPSEAPDSPHATTPNTRYARHARTRRRPTARMQFPMPMPCTPAPSTLADMQSLLDVYFRSTSGTHVRSRARPALIDTYPPPSPSPSAGTGRDKPLPKRPPPPPDRDSVFAWSWLGRMAPDDPREPWNVDARANTDANGNADGFECAYWPSVADSGYESETGCDDGDSFLLYAARARGSERAVVAVFACTGTSTPLAAATLAHLALYVCRRRREHWLSAAAGIAGREHVYEARSTRLERRLRFMDLRRGGAYHHAAPVARL